MTFFEICIGEPRVTCLPAKAMQLSLLVLLVMVGICTSATAQSGVVYLPPAGKSQSKPTNSPPKAVTVDDVIRLSKAGICDDVIIAQIKKRPQPFDLSADELIHLKAEQVSDAVIAAMTGTSGIHAPMPAANSSPPNMRDRPSVGNQLNGDPNDPLADHEPGIYVYYTDREGVHRLVELEPTVYTQNKMGGVFTSAMTYGIAKMHWKAVVHSPHAAVNTADHEPVFYFYFERKGAGLSYSSFASSTPNEFVLLRFDVKKDARETTVMQGSAWGMQSGTQENAVTSFDYTKIRPGVYKVAPKASLHSGEYCFFSSQGGAFAPGAASSNRLFDFGISSSD